MWTPPRPGAKIERPSMTWPKGVFASVSASLLREMLINNFVLLLWRWRWFSFLLDFNISVNLNVTDVFLMWGKCLLTVSTIGPQWRSLAEHLTSATMLIGNGGGVDLTRYTTELFYYPPTLLRRMVSGGLGFSAWQKRWQQIAYQHLPQRVSSFLLVNHPKLTD